MSKLALDLLIYMVAAPTVLTSGREGLCHFEGYWNLS